MATNEGTAFDLTIAAEAGSVVLGLVQLAVMVIPLLTVALLVLSHLRHGHGRVHTVSSVWPSSTSAGTRYLFGEISSAEYRRAVAGRHRMASGIR